MLPTSGSARFASPLGVSDFLKRAHIMSYSRRALEKTLGDIEQMAQAEGLPAHANSVRIRLQELSGPSNGER